MNMLLIYALFFNYEQQARQQVDISIIIIMQEENIRMAIFADKFLNAWLINWGNVRALNSLI